MKKHPPDPAVECEAEFVAGLTKIFEEMIVFNQVIGLIVTSIKGDRVTGNIGMRRELVGHHSHHRIHGYVISAGLDAMDAVAVMAAIGARHMNEAPAQRFGRFGKLGTIDLGIDYLRPGIGDHFDLRGSIAGWFARGNHPLALLGADGELLSTGAGAHIVS